MCRCVVMVYFDGLYRAEGIVGARHASPSAESWCWGKGFVTFDLLPSNLDIEKMLLWSGKTGRLQKAGVTKFCRLQGWKMGWVVLWTLHFEFVSEGERRGGV